MRRRNLARAAALLVLVAFAGRGDHLPEELHATGKAETKLAGLSITRKGLNVSEAIKLYGAPTGRNVAARNPAWIGYRWIFGDAILEVSTADGKITDVYVEGTAKGAVARTGAGLMLGDGLAKLEAIYGPKFLDRRIPDVRIGGASKRRSDRIAHTGVWENHTVIVQWREPEYTLIAGLDERGRIVSLWLLRPECFSGECE